MKTLSFVKDMVDLVVTHDEFMKILHEKLKFELYLRTYCDTFNYFSLSNYRDSQYGLLEMFRHTTVCLFSKSPLKDITHAILGKGIVFDTGGWNLKSKHGIYGMHFDKAGAMASIGAFLDGLNKNTAVIVGFAVNDLNLFPGTILISKTGKKVEIQDTDAEGRILLSGLIEKAVSTFPNLKHITTIATLTGSIMGALDKQYAGFLSTNDKLRLKIFNKADELELYPMPTFPKLKPYKAKRKGVDLVNIDITNAKLDYAKAFMFMKEFVPNNIHLNHLDIAGVAADSNWNATGYGIKQLRAIDKLIQ
jgi:leucyl aminopeptidase